MATYYGKLSEFEKDKEDWTSYVERLELFFKANEITEEDKQKAILLSSCGASTYKLFKGLAAPTKPKDKSLTELVTLMKEHQEPKPNPIAERFKFNTRDRKSNETVAQYMAELRRLTEFCEYGTTLDNMLRDRLVCGMKHERIQQRLLGAGATLTLTKALDTALSMESAIQQSSIIKSYQHTENQSSEIHKVERQERKQDMSQNCFRCEGRHQPNSCPFKDKECFFCHKKGHITKVCRSKSRRSTSDQVKQLEDERDAISDGDDEIFNIYYNQDSKTKRPPFKVTVAVNMVPITMEIDTGASVSIISEHTFNLLKCKSNIHLSPVSIKLRTYSGEIITPMGGIEVNIEHSGKSIEQWLLVIKGNRPNLLGRDLLSRIQLDWGKVFSTCKNVNNVQEIDKLNNLLLKYENVFSPELGTMKGVKVSIDINPEATPRFFKARPVPYAIKEKIERELERLVKEGIFKPVNHSKWATPIVPVIKKDGDIRICGDYKQTVNRAANCDKYPVPKTEDLLATLNGGEKFSKLDLSQAYQQLVLEPKSREYLTINTHKGLFQPTRLQFGVHSAAGIFQREMEKRLSHVPFTIVRMDDILISGKNDTEHFRNLKAVLDILKNYDLHLKRKKCVFMAGEVTYLGFRINKEGVTLIPERISDLQLAKTPQDVTQLKSFLGMVNYYHRHLPNLAHILEPLHLLLRKNTTWKWGKEQQNSFIKVKEILCSPNLLVHYDSEKPLILSCDASLYGLGAVLSHIMPDGSERPIAYTSRTLNPAERNYAQIEMEGLAIIYAVKKYINIFLADTLR